MFRKLKDMNLLYIVTAVFYWLPDYILILVLQNKQIRVFKEQTLLFSGFFHML